jgi:3-oxoacyl-[acyl-carrier protein] reductase
MSMETANTDQGVVMSLAGKTALITGGSRGIGAAAVRLFVQAGAQVAFSYERATAKAEAVVAECGGEAHCVALQQELSTADQGRALVERAAGAFGKLDILVANHGIWPAGITGIDAMSDQHWQRTLGVNLDSVFGLLQATVLQMRKQGRRDDGEPSGRMVLISSTSGQRGEAFHADYSVTKSAIISLTKSLSAELAADGIRVNCVAPGWVETDMSRPATGDPVRRAEIVASIPLRRPGEPEEIAGPILFLCTPFSNFMNGSVMSVNGGAVLAG